ncbi:hypothetical protein [Pseudonocardia sp. NPDC049154]|uniref:hypothetical protein n=1 Tax=Pseudonocardia sp. NPDC049154 TaxID=3155501 RepID=UPI003407EC80
MAGLVVIVDILRFRAGFAELAYLNLVLVWGLAFMSGFFYSDLVRAPRQVDAALLWAGLFGLVGLSYAFAGRLGEREVPDLVRWLERPLYIGVSLLCTVPVIWLFGRFGHRRPTVPAPA